MGLNGKSFAPKQKAFTAPNVNLAARAAGSASFQAGRAAGAANKDIGAAMALVKQHALKSSTKTAATNAPGPKRV